MNNKGAALGKQLLRALWYFLLVIIYAGAKLFAVVFEHLAELSKALLPKKK